MAMTKYTDPMTAESPQTQGAMLAIVTLVAYNNPTLFIKLLQQNKQTDTVLELLMNNYKDLMWPQQKAFVFGMSSLLTIDKKDIPPSLGQKYLQLIDVTAKCVIYMNWEEYHEEDETDDDEEDSNDDQAAVIAMLKEDEKKEKGMDHDDDDDEEDDSEEESEDGSFMGDKNDLVDVDANEDYMNQSDLRYMSQCCEMTDNHEFMMTMLDDWGESSSVVPRSPLDEENEVIYFNNCVNQFAQNFPQIVNEWKKNLDERNKKLLAKYLKESQDNMKDYQKRIVASKKETAEREQMARKAIDAAKNLHLHQLSNGN